MRNLSFFHILIIPAVFFYGYNYRVVKLSTQSMINEDVAPPVQEEDTKSATNARSAADLNKDVPVIFMSANIQIKT